MCAGGASTTAPPPPPLCCPEPPVAAAAAAASRDMSVRKIVRHMRVRWRRTALGHDSTVARTSARPARMRAPTAPSNRAHQRVSANAARAALMFTAAAAAAMPAPASVRSSPKLRSAARGSARDSTAIA